MKLLTPTEAMEEGLVLLLEKSLNDRLRPGQETHLKYARTPRLAFDLQVEHELRPSYSDGVVTVDAETAQHEIRVNFAYRSDKDKPKALCLAIASAALAVLRTKEKEKEDEPGSRI